MPSQDVVPVQDPLSSLFIEGFSFEAEVYDFNSASIKTDIEALQKAHQAIQDRKIVDVDALNRVCTV